MSEMQPVYPANGLLLYGEDLVADTPLALGVRVELPPLEAASVETLNRLDDALRHLLLGLGENYRMQIRWSISSDYDEILEPYAARTLECRTELNKWVRRERLERHLQQQGEGRLRREHLVIYVATSGASKLRTLQPREIRAYLAQQKRNLKMLLNPLISMLGDVPYEILDDLDNYREWYRQQNPSCRIRDKDEFWKESFDPEYSLQWMSENSDTRLSRAGDAVGFCLDGYYQGMLVLREWPAVLHPGDIRHLTNGGGEQYAIVQNIRPLLAGVEIEREIAAIKRLRRELTEKETGFVHRVELERRQEKLDALQEGRVKPYRVLTILRTWAETEEELGARMLELKTALDGWGARYYQVQQVFQARNLFCESLPGNLYTGYRGYDLYATSDFLPSLLPASSTFVGTGNTINEGEILLEGENGNLCTLNLFAGDNPQNAVVIGTRGSGKSVLLDEVLGQCGDQFDFLCILEEGLSHAVLTRLMGGTPIVVTPDCGLTLNYFDTRGLPLTQGHLAFCRAITMKMCGISHDTNHPGGEWLREYIQTLYWDFYRSWMARNQERWCDLSRLAYALEARQKQAGADRSDPVQAFRELREWRDYDYEAYCQWIHQFPTADIEEFVKSSEGELAMRNLSFAFFRSEEFPCHRHLVELLQYHRSPRHPESEISWLIARLKDWTCEEGVYGPLLDGVSNLSLDQRILHFELGQIPETAREVKDLVAFLLTSLIRQEVIRRPRSTRKAILIEEASRFREIPGGDRIIAELYAQMRKFSCWVLIVLQQYAQIRESTLKSVVFGNSNQLWLLRNNDREDLEEIARFNDIPDSAVETILQYPLPEHQHQGEGAGYFFYWNKAGLNGGTVCVRPCPEMLYIASSGGAHYDRREKRLAGYADLWAGVCAEARQKFGQKEEAYA